jgi:hypothetical protein
LTVNTQLIARKVPKEIDQHLAKETSKIRNAHKLFDSLTFIQFFMDPFHTVYRDADDVPWQVKYLRHSRKSNTSGTAGGLKYVNRSKRLKNHGPPQRWRQFI